MNRNSSSGQDRIRLIVEVGLTIALATVLNALKVFQMPQGGTISLVMLPIFVLSLRRGLRVGLLAGLLYGFVDFMIDGYVVHWVQYLLDYPLAYAAVGLAGVGSKAWSRFLSSGKVGSGVTTVLAPSVALGALGRYAAHVVSGAVFFAEYAPEGQPVLIYSSAYNSYVLVSAVACLAAAAVVLPVLSRAVPLRGHAEV